LGVKVLRFSIGFGKTLLRKIDRTGTEYVIALIPLGGYVQMLDESEGDVPAHELHRAYNRQPYYKKMLIVLAGPAMNILCALILYWIIFMIGFTSIKPMIGKIEPGSIAAQAGLQANQEIIATDGYDTRGWASFILRLLAHAGNQDTLQVAVKSASGVQSSHTLNLKNWQLDGLSPDPLTSIGLKPYTPDIPLIVGQIAPDSPAAKAGVQKHDKLIAINNQPIPTWEMLITTITEHPDESIQLTVSRQGKHISLPITLSHKRQLIFFKTGYLGIGPDFTWPENMMNDIQYGPIEAIPHAAQQLYDFTYFNLLLIGKLFVGNISLQSLGGPITIFDTAGTALNIGLLSFLSFLAFLSISIGVVNLLPIPGLDGGHLFLQTIECLIGRKIPDRMLIILYRLGFTILFFVLTISLINDLLRLG
jgi:regulator of sigma E protease